MCGPGSHDDFISESKFRAAKAIFKGRGEV